MSQAAGAYIYTGPWTNWSHGHIHGLTITLSTRNGAILIAFLALLIKFAGSQMWGIVKYATHQLRASQNPRDGPFHQSQAILRNADSANQAVLEILQAPLYWRKHAKRPFRRSLALAILPLVNLVLFGIAGILSSEVSKATGSEVLIRSNNCGFFDTEGNPGDPTSPAFRAFNAKTLNDTLTSATYARNCYESNASNVLRCDQYAQQRIEYTTNRNATCPFSNGLCRTAAYEVDSGPIDSHVVLGINARPEDRVSFRKVTTCATIHTKGYNRIFNGTVENGFIPGDTFEQYLYGPVTNLSGGIYNFTYQYDLHAFLDNNGYALTPMLYYSGSSEIVWFPIDDLNRTDSDMTLLFLAGNSIKYEFNVSDPWFSANTVIAGEDGQISPDLPVNPLACIDQWQFCNPNNKACTSLTGLTTNFKAINTIGLNPSQLATALRISETIPAIVTGSIVQGRGAASLRAQESVYNLVQGPLPDDQWITELNYWFDTGLAILQDQTVQFAAGPPNLPEGSFVNKVNSTDGPNFMSMCRNQKVRGQSMYQSFSVLGLACIVVITVLLTLLNLLLPSVMSVVRKVFPKGRWKDEQWRAYEKLQMQRMVFESRNLGTWSAEDGAVPVTTGMGEKFSMVSNKSHVGHSMPAEGAVSLGTMEERGLMAGEYKPVATATIGEAMFHSQSSADLLPPTPMREENHLRYLGYPNSEGNYT